MIIREWAKDYQIPTEWIYDLEQRMTAAGVATTTADGEDAASESAVQQKVRFEAARAGILLWRNNIGALIDDRGVPVRYGLCNDTKALNEQFKFPDLIGITKKVITPMHVGSVVGIFTGREIKKVGWKYTGKGRERAQLNAIELINAQGGDACFATGPGTF